jgi:hypothetical protein
VNGKGQEKRSENATGEIVAFHTSENFDFVAGEAAQAYSTLLTRFTRNIIFIKPELIVIYDQLEAPKPSIFDWHLHSPTKMTAHDQKNIRTINKRAACDVAFLAPDELRMSLTNSFDVPPRPGIKLVEWHLTAKTPKPKKSVEFVTIIRPYQAGTTPPTNATLKKIDGGYFLDAELNDGKLLMLLRANGKDLIEHEKFRMKGDIVAVKLNAKGQLVDSIEVKENAVRHGHKKRTKILSPNQIKQ